MQMVFEPTIIYLEGQLEKTVIFLVDLCLNVSGLSFRSYTFYI